MKNGKYYFDKDLYNYDNAAYLPTEMVDVLHDKVVTPLGESRLLGEITFDQKEYMINLGHCVID